ncbi:hypothetical protein [Pseudalkalibacillus berkeleyi]|uniref:Uncharacterized protein n=1 Tax=Pseudalkalibacillus berkeleyi TaxID=1069813 RepID=A0ABS9H0T9_9BACL|nr:hypothetical protein [Pseudalkalibacillus berkeleyi]MCF6137534.1 hypothetical protein [Pseudalkalibacillus berkeleyi]
MMEFLYFPEDKTEYIPSVTMLIIFMAAAIIATILIRKHSAKELTKFEQEHQNHNVDENTKKNDSQENQ